DYYCMLYMGSDISVF
nr:immunoglobulin light chain junction region [Macaca mulatta]MOW59761.1 immunoglobulin light chain junction region [Macaca mulatta]